MNLNCDDLYSDDGLEKINNQFNWFFQQQNPELFQDFFTLKNKEKIFSKKEKDTILINSAKLLEDFLVLLFDIKNENEILKNQHQELEKIYFVKKEFIQRIVAKKYNQLPYEINKDNILKELDLNEKDVNLFEKKFAEKVFLLLKKEKNLNEEEKNIFELFCLYSAFALYSDLGKKFHQDGVLFNLPQKIDYENLVKRNYVKNSRDGFNLTDQGFNLNQALDQANYCIFCHNQEKDSCRTGLKEKNSDEFKKNPCGIKLEGCPLDQKISEMNLLKQEGFSIASIAVAAIDNPLMAGTGHRICNDCMKSCIFQKQDPVNIPQIESENLKDVLNLPWGFEIYSLLTRWNPLNFDLKISQKFSPKKILVAGLGPAGYTLSHYLLNQGHLVVAIDGLRIEPLNPEISGIDFYGNRKKFKLIKHLDQIYQPLSSRLIQGFGGVAEYGITSRWDKNFLTIIRLLLERRKNFRMFGGIRFGSSINDESAFREYNFDHIALCIGAGRPNIIDIKNNFAKGIRMASDFLMSLQLNGAFKEELFTNLQLRAPIIVVGAGLTAVDTACEAQEYYFVQIKKFLQKFKKLSEIFGEEKIWNNFNEEEKNIAREFLDHAFILENQGKEELLKKIGFAKILYRKKIQDSPAYKLNHEELIKAFEQGIEFIEEQEIEEAILDEFQHIKAVKCKNGQIFECSSLLVAAGTSPNVSIVLEDNLNLELDNKYFSQIDKNGKKINITNSLKSGDFSIFTRIDDNKKAISFFGDLHPNFEGNVVKAMASAKFGYKKIDEILQEIPQNNKNIEEFFAKINQDFLVEINKIEKISDYSIYFEIKAPLLAKHSEIGQIFRMQNYHAFAKKTKGQILAMEGVVLTALKVDKELGIIGGVVLDYGGSTSLIKNFELNEPLIFMGPSGKPTELSQNENVLLIGAGRGNLPLCAIASELKKLNNKIIFCAAYHKNQFVSHQEERGGVSDVTIYAIEDEAPNLTLARLQDFQAKGNVVEVLKKYFAQNDIKIDRIFVIGGDKMMAEIAKIRHENLIPNITNAPIAITSLNASMQCMMKGVCSQCLQKRKNQNGEFEYFYACTSQDQDMDKIDFNHLIARCDQNSTQEKMTKMWIEYLMNF